MRYYIVVMGSGSDVGDDHYRQQITCCDLQLKGIVIITNIDTILINIITIVTATAMVIYQFIISVNYKVSDGIAIKHFINHVINYTNCNYYTTDLNISITIVTVNQQCFIQYHFLWFIDLHYQFSLSLIHFILKRRMFGITVIVDQLEAIVIIASVRKSCGRCWSYGCGFDLYFHLYVD